MKKFKFFLVALLFSNISSVLSQECWNADNNTYANLKENLQWVLPAEYGEWYIAEDYRMPKYMLFAASQRDTGIGVILIKDTIQMKTNEIDIWEHGNEFLDGVLAGMTDSEKLFPGNDYRKPTVENCYFLGKKALKFNGYYSTIDDRYGDEPIEFFYSGYCFDNRGYIYVVNVMVLSEIQKLILNEYGIDFTKSILLGFSYVNPMFERHKRNLK